MARSTGRVALITGGGAGVDRVAAERFAQDGAKVVVAEINEVLREAAAASARAEAKAGGEAVFVRCDVAEKARVTDAVAKAIKRFDKLHILHNNADGATPRDGGVTGVPVEEFWRAIKLDLFDTFLCSKVAIPEIAKVGGGSIINMSSIVALMAMPRRDCYTAAKGGISALKRSMAVECASDLIRVSAIAPSVTLSEHVKKQLEGNPATEELGRQNLLGLIEPINIADMAVYLASEESGRTMGQILPVDSRVTIR